MPRGRILSRCISTSVSIEAMSEWAQLLFDRLVIHADDYGLLEGDPRVLKATAKPISNRQPAEFAEAVAEMITAGAVAAYVVNRRIYLHVIRHDEHQRISKKTPSRYPPPNGSAPLTASVYLEACSPGFSWEISGDLGESHLREEKRREEEVNTPCSPPQAGDTIAEHESKRTRKKAATHMTPEWRPTSDVIAEMQAECPAVDVERAIPEFRDYWIGEGKPKADWNSTFRNRIRTINERRTGSTSAQRTDRRGPHSDGRSGASGPRFQHRTAADVLGNAK